MADLACPSMSVANFVIPIGFGISCIATVLTIVFTIVLVVYYKKIKNFKCENEELEEDDSGGDEEAEGTEEDDETE